MDVLIAIGHIGGAIFAVVLFGVVILLIGNWETEKNKRQALEDASIALGVAIEDLEREDILPKLIQRSSLRYNSELFSNRVSDLCGEIRTVWGWLGSLLQIAILVGVVWYTFTDSVENAVYIWWIIAVAIMFWLISIVFSVVCKLLTGRYPGEAKQTRKNLAQLISARTKHASESR